MKTVRTVPTVCFAALCVGAFWLGSDAGRQSREEEPIRPFVDKPTPPPLKVAEKQLNLGRVWESNAHTHQLEITNTGDAPVTLTRFMVTCDCLVGITPDSKVTFQPHETRSFALKLRLIANTCSTNPLDRLREVLFGVRLSALYSIDGKSEQPVHWPLTCVIIPTLHLKQSRILLGTVSDRQEAVEQSLAVEVASNIASLECEAPDYWRVKIEPGPKKSWPKQFRVVIRSEGKLIPRKVSDAIRLIPVNGNNIRLPEKELRMEGEIVPDVVTIPPQIHYGLQPCGAVVADALCLRSLTNRRFHVRRVTTQGDNLEISQWKQGRTDWVYSLQTLCAKPGDQQTTAEFLIEEEDGACYTISAPVSYHGEEISKAQDGKRHVIGEWRLPCVD